MVERKIVYLDNCIYSELLNKNKVLLEKISSNKSNLVFSYVHLIEMNDKCKEFSTMALSMNLGYIENKNFENSSNYHIYKYNSNCEYLNLFQMVPLFKCVDAVMPIINHYCGGQKETDQKKIIINSGEEMKNLLNGLFIDIPGCNFTSAPANITNQQKEITERILHQDLHKDWDKIENQKIYARFGDKMRNMTASEKIDFIFSNPDQEEIKSISHKYPKFFAKHNYSTFDISGFSFMLFMLGIIKMTRVFNGKQQIDKFKAQFRDCLHIGEASHCDYFITLDKGAAELAEATYTYAGVKTKSILLEMDKDLSLC